MCFSLGLFSELVFGCWFQLRCGLGALLLLSFSSWCRRIFVGGHVFSVCWSVPLVGLGGVGFFVSMFLGFYVCVWVGLCPG